MMLRRITGKGRAIGRYAPCRRLTARHPGVPVGRDTVRIHGEAGWMARLVLLKVYGLIKASSMFSRRHPAVAGRGA